MNESRSLVYIILLETSQVRLHLLLGALREDHLIDIRFIKEKFDMFYYAFFVKRGQGGKYVKSNKTIKGNSERIIRV